MAALRVGARRKLPRHSTGHAARPQTRRAGGKSRHTFVERASICGSSGRRTETRPGYSPARASGRQSGPSGLQKRVGPAGSLAAYAASRPSGTVDAHRGNPSPVSSRPQSRSRCRHAARRASRPAQLDLARAAIELGIRNVFAVAKLGPPVEQRLAEFHAPAGPRVERCPKKRGNRPVTICTPTGIVVTGAQVFDEWFDKKPSTSREAFCARLGLRADRPILLYVCSSLLEASPEEPAFILRWIRHLRESQHPVLRECGILVRRHPERDEGWDRSISPGWTTSSAGHHWANPPVDERSKTDYFDSMYHAAAVVGLNTSAMIEAAIVGRPVHTVLLPEFWDNQEGTLHFHYLLDGPNALLRATRSLDDHARDLAGILEGRDPDPTRSARFVSAFVRPRGIDVPSTTRVVDELEAVGSSPLPYQFRCRFWCD